MDWSEGRCSRKLLNITSLCKQNFKRVAIECVPDVIVVFDCDLLPALLVARLQMGPQGVSHLLVGNEERGRVLCDHSVGEKDGVEPRSCIDDMSKNAQLI